jgi:hypothetical protein
MSPQRTRRTRSPALSRARGTAALLAAVLLVATLGACSGGSDDSDDGGGDSGAASEAAGDAQGDGLDLGAPERSDGGLSADDSAAAPESGNSTGSQLSPALDLTAAQLDGRDIIRTGSISLVTREPTTTRDRIVSLVTVLGGYVSDESAQVRGSDGVDQIRVVIQVPTAQFDEAVERISNLGKEKSRTINAQDVTAQVADIDSRVDSARAALDRIRALLDRATSLGTVIRLEGVLSNRQADLEALLAQQAALAGQTKLGTIEVNVSGRKAAVSPPEKDEDETRGFVEGLQAGWNGLSEAFVVGSTGLGAMLPFAVLLALIGAPALLWRRRRIPPQQPAPTASSQ